MSRGQIEVTLNVMAIAKKREKLGNKTRSDYPTPERLKGINSKLQPVSLAGNKLVFLMSSAEKSPLFEKRQKRTPTVTGLDFPGFQARTYQLDLYT